ncbi:MAG TPA: spherulation-specific family 4 protein, partial [Nitrosopumilaceae archaeon]|nr:spherulation-specific family 4 protein [Nitrosopumilaceae archaeon]
MKVQSSRTFVGIFMIMLMVFVPFSTTIHPAVAATPTGVIVPLYSYPGNYWTQLIQAKNAHPSVPVIAIINPSSGSGSASDSNYVTGIKNLQSAGITVLGYVYTSYAARSITAAEADINSYKTWYNVNGIMFDEMSNVPGNENYYSTLTQYVKSHGMTMTVGNPGASTLASYVGTVDNITIYEGSGVPTASTLSTRIFSPTYPSSDFSMVSFGVSTLDTTAEKNASPYVSYLYITNDVLSNPYDTVPPYIGNEVAALDTATATASQPPTGVTTTAVSSSQINLSWIAPVNNGGSAILGYKIERSIDSGTTWTTIVSNTASTTTTYSDTGLFPNTSYTYRVSAINSIGTSSPSSMSSTTTSSATSVPSSPAVLTAKTASSSQINLSWTAPTNNGGSAITNYNIYRSTSSGTETFLVRIGNVLSYSDTGLSSGTTYFYKVTAVNSAGESTQSNEATTSLTTPTTNTSNDLATRLGGINTGIYYPMYSLSELPQVLAAKQAFPNVPFNVNINPASGPGTAPSTSWASAITQLKSAGAVVTGYVPTGYGTRTVANVEGMISSYNQFYPNMLDGIMFDEVSGSCSEFTFYQSISNYAKSIGYNYIRANPGSSICQTDVPLFNHIAIFESAGYPSESTLASNTFYPQYPKDVVGFGATIHTTPTYDPTWLHMATKYLKWVYITDQTEPNPYAVFPSYFNQYLTDLSSLAVTTTPPPSPTSPGSPTSLTATAASSSQINLSWTAPTSNGGSAITGYKIERSTDSGTTWSTSIANTASTATTYSDTGLVASTAYKHRVSAINSVGTSSPSTTSSATTMSGSTTTIPQPPTGLTGSAVSSSQINLSWTAPTSNGGSAITGYKIERSTDSGTTWSTIVANTANTAI